MKQFGSLKRGEGEQGKERRKKSMRETISHQHYESTGNQENEDPKWWSSIGI